MQPINSGPYDCATGHLVQYAGHFFHKFAYIQYDVSFLVASFKNVGTPLNWDSGTLTCMCSTDICALFEIIVLFVLR